MTRLALLLVAVEVGGCLGIEGTDVSTGAAPSTTGDGGYDSTATADPATTEPSTTIGTSPTDTNAEGTTDGASESDSEDPTSNDTSGRLSTDSSGEDGAPGTSSDSGDVVDTDDSTGTETGTETGTDTGSESSSSTDTGGTCGDGELQDTEECDGELLGKVTCVDLEFDGGVLACDPATCLFDVSACFE
jgi:hypothetical protein